MSKKLDRYEFIWKAIQKHGYKYDYRKVNYINDSTKVCIICSKHGEFWQAPGNHCSKYNKNGCPQCNHQSYKYTLNNFVERTKLIHGDKYDYSKVVYKNGRTKICIICPIHGEFYQEPRHHLKGCGCPSCNESKLEKEICLLLDENNIKHERQKRFKWLGRQSLDFYLPDYNIAIECQGRQHFESINYFGGTKTFFNTVKNDYNKLNKCKLNNICLLYYVETVHALPNEFINKKDLLTYIKRIKMNEQETFQTTMGINFTNFDVNNIQEAETINVVFVIDKSSSTNRFINDLNNTLNEFLHEFQRSHVASKMLISVIEFNSNIDVVSAFQPISDLKDFNVQPYGCTNLYGAVLAGLENAVQYRKDLENNGISVKTLVFIITDGEDNEGVDPSLVKQKIDEIYQDESNCFSFTVMMFGLGDEANFDEAREKMGIKPEMLGKLGATAKDLRKMVSFISSSVSSSASGQNVSAITF